MHALDEMLMLRARSSIIGDVGEARAIFEFTRYGIPVLLPMSDNLPYDLVIDCLGRFLKVQVKTCSKLTDGKMYFKVCQNNAFTGEHWSYSRSDVDLFFLYCIENDSYALVDIDDILNVKSITIRLDNDIALNNQVCNVKYLSNYSLEKTLSKLGLEASLE